MAVEIFKLFGSIFVNNDEANKSIAKTDKNAEGLASRFSSGVKTVGKWGTAIVGSATAAAGGMIQLAESSASTADTIDKASQKIGLSREAYQELDFICSQSGTDVSKLGAGMKTLRSAMNNDKNAEIFDALGISITDANGKLRDSQEVMWDAMNALQGVADQDEKAALAQKLFGKAGQELMPLLNGQAGSIDKMKQKAHELGLVMSDEMVDSGVALTDSLDQTKRAFTAIITKLGGSLMPIVKKASDFLQKALPYIQSGIEKFEPIVTGFLEKMLPPLMDMAKELFPALMNALEQLLPSLEQIATALLPVFTDLITQLMPVITNLISQLMPVIVQLVEAILPVFTQLLEQIMPVVSEIIETVLPVFIDLFNLIMPILSDLIAAVLPLLSDLLGVIFDALKPLLELLSQLVKAVLPALKPLLELLSDIFKGVLGNAVKFISERIENLVKVFKGIIDFVTGVFTGDWDKAWNGVVNIFKGIFNTIPSIIEFIINGAIGLINNLLGGLEWATQWLGFEIPKIPEVTLPRFRAGIELVPYDKYPALLDAGEMVLSAHEADEYRREKREEPAVKNRGEGRTYNQTFNISVTVEKLNDKFDIRKLASQLSELIAEEIRNEEYIYA